MLSCGSWTVLFLFSLFISTDAKFSAAEPAAIRSTIDHLQMGLKLKVVNNTSIMDEVEIQQDLDNIKYTSSLKKTAEASEQQVSGLLEQLGKARASIAWLSAKLDDAADAVKRANESCLRWERREAADEHDKDSALKAQEVALGAERAEKKRADRFKDLEMQAEVAAKLEGVKEAAARNATTEAQMWAMREENELAVAQTRLEQTHFEEQRQRDRMRSAEERANMSSTIAEAARENLAVAQGQMKQMDADNVSLRALVAAAEQEGGEKAEALKEAKKAQDLAQVAVKQAVAAQRKAEALEQQAIANEQAGREALLTLKGDSKLLSHDKESLQKALAQAQAAREAATEERARAEAVTGRADKEREDALHERQDALQNLQRAEAERDEAVEEEQKSRARMEAADERMRQLEVKAREAQSEAEASQQLASQRQAELEGTEAELKAAVDKMAAMTQTLDETKQQLTVAQSQAADASAEEQRAKEGEAKEKGQRLAAEVCPSCVMRMSMYACACL